MAYLNFSEIGATIEAAQHAVAPVRTGFTALEWSVIAIAQRDSLRTLENPGRVSVALGVVFGGQRPNPRLADDRLETLRRVAVHAWHRGYAVPDSELRAFHDAGFSDAQYELLQDSISRGVAARNRIN